MNKEQQTVVQAAAAAAVVAVDIKYIKDDIGQLQGDVKSVLENHLPHLQTELEKLNTRITLFTAINIGGIVLGIIATYFFRL